MLKHIKNKTTRKEIYMTSQRKKTLTQEILNSNISSDTKKELLTLLSSIKTPKEKEDSFRSLSIQTQMELLL